MHCYQNICIRFICLVESNPLKQEVRLTFGVSEYCMLGLIDLKDQIIAFDAMLDEGELRISGVGIL